MSGFATGSVPARIWKRDFGLWRTEKDASRNLAIKIFPQMQDLLKYAFLTCNPVSMMNMTIQ